jgi:hypothetical protein
MAFTHVVLFRWKPEATQEHIDDITRSLRALSADLGGCRSYRCGPSLGLTPTSFDFGVAAEFDDQESWQAYVDDAEHARIRDELIAPIAAERAGIQMEQ